MEISNSSVAFHNMKAATPDKNRRDPAIRQGAEGAKASRVSNPRRTAWDILSEDTEVQETGHADRELSRNV
jgi:hypothetical protein